MQLVRALAWTYRNAARSGATQAHRGGRPCRGWAPRRHDVVLPLEDVAPTCRPQLVHSALAISGVFDLLLLREAPFLKDTLKLTPAAVRKLSPALFPKPKGTLCAVVGANESEEHLRQTALIQQAGGRRWCRCARAFPTRATSTCCTTWWTRPAGCATWRRDLLGLG